MVTKLRNNKILCIIWVFFCSFFFIAAIRQYSIDSLDGYFCRHSIDYTNQYSLTPPTTPAYTTEDISASYTVVSYSDNVTMPTASDYTGYTAFIFYMTMAGFLLCIIGGFFFNGFHPRLYQEVFLFLFFFCLFQLLGDSLPVLIYQNFGKLVWPFLFLCIVLGIICAVSLLCFLWSWNSKGFHGSLFGEWLFQKISAKKLSSQIFYVILTSFILSAAACAVLIRIVRTYFYNFQSSKFFVPFFVFASLIIFISILFFFLIGRHSITADMDLIIKKSIRTTLEQERLKVDLITNISHDLKTPLTSIIGYGEQLSRQMLSPEADALVSKLNHKSLYLLDMVEEVFELSKASSGHLPMKRETIDIGRLLEQTLGEMDEELCESGFQLKKDYPLTGMHVLCDGLHMHRVFQNLFDNALKYACPQTRIFIHASQRSNQFCEIRIRNTSRVPLDFDPEEITKRFVRGEKARTGEGSGLGLAIAKTYTESCGGQFHIVIEDDCFIAVVCLPSITS